jgi:hypothetical protein
LVCLGLAAATLAACGADDSGSSEESLGSSRDALTVTATFQQGVNSYTGSTDATIKQASASSNFGSATTCEVDGDDGGGVDKSCLLQWALSGLPADAVVTSASIKLQIVNASANTYSLYELLRGWNEGEVTWNRATASNNWATSGALGATDRGSVIGSVTGATGSKTITLNSAGISMIQNWINNPTSNHGIVIANASNTDGIDFASSETSTAAQRPLLSVTYTTNSGAGVCGSTAAPPARYDHVVIFSFENRTWSNVGLGFSTMPYLKSLATQC